jgi:NhaA family Na+:H+ antiporter
MPAPDPALSDDGLISTRPQPPSQAVSGLVLLLCAVGALLWANSRWQDSYVALWHVTVGPATLQHVINDGLMALFFLLVGLEIKHELLDGALASWQRAALPVVGAIGGMLVPATIFALVARGTDAAPGWGIPMATDIAFALGIVALLGDRVPSGLRVFLAALAIADDIGAVLVIAMFYTPQVAWPFLGVTALLMLVLFALNRRGVSAVWPYALLGLALWVAVYRSGIHASIAGVLLALTIPARGPRSVQHRIEHALQHPVTFGVVPLFALANAGVTLPADLLAFGREPAVLATALGLVIGKPVGIFGAAWLAVRLRLAALPADADWSRVFGVAVLGGIGFTMSLFIAGLAFADQRLDAAKVGVLAGSLVTGVLGALILAHANRRTVRA